MSEKTLSFGFPFFLRVLVPGVFGSTIVSIILLPWTGVFQDLAKSLGLLAATTLTLGLFISFADDFIYRLYEARAFWPKWLRQWMMNRLKRKVRSIYKRAGEIPEDTDHLKRELSTWLARFGLSTDGRPMVVSPTEMGNIILGYESIPYRMYAMDPNFYWPRLWLKMDDNTRKEIDKLWATADRLTYLSFTALISIPILAFFFALSFFWSPWNEIEAENVTIMWGVTLGVLVILWLGFYKLSIPHHVVNGGLFKAIFDVFRKDISTMQINATEATLEQKFWWTTWQYLKYFNDRDDESVSVQSSSLSSQSDIVQAINDLESQMQKAANRLEFEKAARLRNTISELRHWTSGIHLQDDS